MDPSERRRWLALAPPEPPPPPRRPAPGKWRAGWRILAEEIAADEAAEAPPAGPPRPPPAMPYRRHRADVARRFHLDPATLEAVKAELEARERERRRQVLADPDPAGDDQGELEPGNTLGVWRE
jgi:hypothetical protein